MVTSIDMLHSLYMYIYKFIIYIQHRVRRFVLPLPKSVLPLLVAVLDPGVIGLAAQELTQSRSSAPHLKFQTHSSPIEALG